MPSTQLTSRELSVLNHLACGLTARAIARSLAISHETVNKHLQNIYRKLGASDRLTAVLTAQRLGILPVLVEHAARY
jgi:DNA-binding NarL/FixJ family response regulator